jgi:hypothetical protein
VAELDDDRGLRERAKAEARGKRRGQCPELHAASWIGQDPIIIEFVFQSERHHCATLLWKTTIALPQQAFYGMP